jgi:F420-dependent oxidoreductase-like protein
MANLSFGVKAAQGHAEYPDMLRIWKETDRNEAFEHCWLFDHLAPVQIDLDGACLDGWSLLAAMATETERVRIGLMVAGATYRHPAIMAKVATTVDIISDGRLDFGVGAGWNVYEHESTGIPLYSPGERLRRFEESCEIWRRLFTEPLVNFDGRYFQLKDARHEPKPVQKPHPPFIIGGNGEKMTLRIAAKYADIWSFNGADLEIFEHKRNVLRRHCEAIGRDESEIEKSIQLRINYDDLAPTVEQIKAFAGAGVTHFILYLQAPFQDGIVERLANEVVANANA